MSLPASHSKDCESYCLYDDEDIAEDDDGYYLYDHEDIAEEEYDALYDDEDIAEDDDGYYLYDDEDNAEEEYDALYDDEDIAKDDDGNYLYDDEDIAEDDDGYYLYDHEDITEEEYDALYDDEDIAEDYDRLYGQKLNPTNRFIINVEPINQGNFGAVNFKILQKYLTVIKLKWVPFRWIFIGLNVVTEVCQATFTQENAVRKISNSFYLKLSVITSCVCLMISIVEAIHEGKESKVVWRKRGYIGWFYYHGGGKKTRPFGRFAIIFGVVSSMIQLCINLLAYVINKCLVEFDMLPLLLSSGYLVAALVDNGAKEMVKCEVHGKSAAKCCKCKMDESV